MDVTTFFSFIIICYSFTFFSFIIIYYSFTFFSFIINIYYSFTFRKTATNNISRKNSKIQLVGLCIGQLNIYIYIYMTGHQTPKWSHYYIYIYRFDCKSGKTGLIIFGTQKVENQLQRRPNEEKSKLGVVCRDSIRITMVIDRFIIDWWW